MEFGVGCRPLIIAMKGHPGTGKSKLAHAIATTLRFPLIDKDDARDCTLPLTTSSSAKQLNDLSYQIIWRIAKTQLDLGLSVVIDSPLSRTAHLDHLKQIAAPSGAHIVIIECMPHNEAKWRQRLEERGMNDAANWHKPATWQDLEKLVEGYNGCYDYDVGDVPKLVIDTTAEVDVQELVSTVLRFIVTHAGSGSSQVDDLIFENMLPRVCT
ncbi:hypothetical protein IFM89_028719 [Coptis chinensis]|uniref:P-loop containing nucleoside triphosphate hydrolase protein n=1 Tax=Coptis chinensis TaxID=261450 RepID=A0A835GYH0_9MAGN|nr:hypothetical protein IFM89_028719 [Coptis chinensis]